jgi:hypothetical protein
LESLRRIEREAAAADALGPAGPQPIKLGDALVDAPGPGARQLGPVGAVGDAVFRQLRELRADLVEGQPDALREDTKAIRRNTGRP